MPYVCQQLAIYAHMLYVFICLFVCLHVIYLPAEYIVEAHTDREQDRRVTEREAEGCQRKGMLLLLLL